MGLIDDEQANHLRHVGDSNRLTTGQPPDTGPCCYGSAVSGLGPLQHRLDLAGLVTPGRCGMVVCTRSRRLLARRTSPLASASAPKLTKRPRAGRTTQPDYHRRRRPQGQCPFLVPSERSRAPPVSTRYGTSLWRDAASSSAEGAEFGKAPDRLPGLAWCRPPGAVTKWQLLQLGQ
jgi:hypothetical protein